MRKLISASKRKWVLGGILGFAAVALTTTGFATWIVGVQRTATNNNIGVNVDTATNSSIQLDTTLDTSVKGETSYLWNTLQLTEPTAVSGSDKLVTTGEQSIAAFADGLKIKFSTIKIQVGAEYANRTSIKGINFSLDYTSNVVSEVEQNANRSNLVKDSYISNERTQDKTVESTYWEYISAPENIRFENSKLTVDPSTGLYTYTISDYTAEFKWGSFFDSNSPAQYYNDIFKDKKLTIENGGKVTQELKAMQAALNGKTITLKASIFEDAA